MLTKLKLALRFLKVLSKLSLHLAKLEETIVASTILLNTKPLRLDKTLSQDKSKVQSTLLYDVLNSHQSPSIEITDFKDESEQAKDSEMIAIEEARRKIRESLHQPWRSSNE